jgi:hypothetical protein
MRGERQLLRLGEYLVGQACRRLPRNTRQERYREWTAELPAILHDPQIRPAPRRAVRMLAYAADTLRGAAKTPARARHRGAPRATAGLTLLLFVALLGVTAWNIWAIVQAPERGLNYLQLTWCVLLLVYFMSALARFSKRTSALLVIISTLVGVAVNLWTAAQAPGGWLNYVWATGLLLSLLVRWLVTRARAKRA